MTVTSSGLTNNPTAALPPSSSVSRWAMSALDSPKPLWNSEPRTPPISRPPMTVMPPESRPANPKSSAPVAVLRAPSLWVLILPFSSCTRMPIAPTLMSGLMRSQSLTCFTASSAAASLAKNASHELLSHSEPPGLISICSTRWRAAAGPTTAVPHSGVDDALLTAGEGGQRNHRRQRPHSYLGSQSGDIFSLSVSRRLTEPTT